MIISEKQIMQLIQCLRETLSIYSCDFTMTSEGRANLYNQILDQQSKELKVIE